MSDKQKTVILNGTKVWFACIMFLIAHGGAGIWWASSLNTRMDQVEYEIKEVKTLVREDLKEVKDEISSNVNKLAQLAIEMRAQQVIQRSS